MRPALKLWIGLAGLGLIATGCTLAGDELYPALDDSPPRVMATFPADGWRQVPTGISAKVWLSEPVEPSSVGPGSLALVSGDHLEYVRYRVETTADGLGRVVLEPAARLVPGVEYELRIGTGLTDLAGNPLVDPLTISFDTLR